MFKLNSSNKIIFGIQKYITAGLTGGAVKE